MENGGGRQNTKVKAFAPPFNYYCPEAASPPRFFIGGLLLTTKKALTNYLTSDGGLLVMPWCLLFSMAGMLSLRSGLFLFYQEKRKSLSAAASRGVKKIISSHNHPCPSWIRRGVSHIVPNIAGHTKQK